MAGEQIGASARSSPSTALLDRHHVVVHAERLGDRRCIVQRFLRGVSVGQHHAAHALGAQRIGRHRGAQRGIDAAGQPEHHALKAVLVDIVAQAEHACHVIGVVGFLGGGIRARLAVPRAAARTQCVVTIASRNAGSWKATRPIGIERKRDPVEHQFILAADLIDVDQRQSRFDHAAHRDIEPMLGLAAPVGRTVRHQQDFAASLGETLDDLRTPDVLADRNADAHAA